MGRRNRKTRNGRRGTSWKDSGLVWFGGGALILALLILPTLRSGPAAHHPQPRDAAHRSRVVPAAQYAAYPRVAEIYRMVAQVPEVIDGVYCYCNCEEHSGHYSLLDCYNSDHAARCDVCLSEGSMAYKLHKEGKSLDQIRSAIDGLYQT